MNKKGVILAFIAWGLLLFGIYTASKKVIGAAAAVAAVAVFATGRKWAAIFPAFTLVQGLFYFLPALGFMAPLMNLYPVGRHVTTITTGNGTTSTTTAQ